MRRRDARVTYGSMPSATTSSSSRPTRFSTRNERPRASNLRLAVVAVDRRDAGGDVPLLVDVLGRRRPPPGSRMIALSASSTVRQASSSASRVRRPGRACQRARAASNRCRVRAVELEVAGDGRADVVGRERVLAREQLVRAHEERDAAPGDGGRRAVAAVAVRRRARGGAGSSSGASAEQLVEAPSLGRRRSTAGGERRPATSCGPCGPLALVADRRQRVGGEVGLEPGRCRA